MTEEIEDAAGRTTEAESQPQEAPGSAEPATPVSQLGAIVPEVRAESPEAEADVAQVAASLADMVPEVVTSEPEEETAQEPHGGSEPEPDPEPAAVAVAEEPAADGEEASAETEASVAEGEPAEDGTAPSEEAPASAEATAVAPPTESSAELDAVAPKSGISWWPFAVYGALWLVFAGLLGYSLYTAPEGVPSVETQYYPYLMLAGVALTLAGPVLALVLYFNGRATAAPMAGFFATLLLRAATITVAGVAIWWIVLIAADFVRLGRLL